MNPSFDDVAEDDELSVTQNARAFVHADRGLFAAHVALQNVYVWGERPGSTATSPAVYAHEGYLEVGHEDQWLRIGRQELHLLNGFYLSSAPWNVAGRSFDAVRGHWESERVTLDAMGVVELAPRPPSDTLTEPTRGDTLGALFAEFKASEDLQPAVWVMARGGGPIESDPERRKLWVGPGARLFATPGHTTVDLNVMAIVGRDTGRTMGAYSVIAHVGQQLGPIGVTAIFDQSSGHACTTDPLAEGCGNDVIQNFDLSFGRNHFLRGYADQVAGVNARDMALQLHSTPLETIRPMLQAHLLQLTNPQGQWLRNGGVPQGQSWIRGNTDPNLGIEVDAILETWPHEGVAIDGGYCFFQPIGAGAQMTGTDAMHYLFVRNRFQF
jgi:hypothetical protein